VIGINDEDLQQRLYLEDNLTLEKAFKMSVHIIIIAAYKNEHWVYITA
jgi:hypothetical protein